jgi:MFS family permease
MKLDLRFHTRLMVFLLISLFVLGLGVLLFELTLTRVFSIILFYDYAFMAISLAFFGLGVGSLVVHILKDRLIRVEELLPSKILISAIAFALSIPVFLVVIGQAIPPHPSSIYLFYLASSVPFLFAGISMALIYLAMPKEINKLYFIDLVGAAAATLLLDSLMQRLGAESVLLFTGLLVISSSFIAALISFILPYNNNEITSRTTIIKNRVKLYGIAAVVISAVFLVINTNSDSLAVDPGITKGLFRSVQYPEINHLSTEWNSFSRVDVIRNVSDPNVLAKILVDADASTPVFRWNGTTTDLQWLKKYMDYMPFELSPKVNHTLVIGSGGGEDVLVALAGGSDKVTAVEINPAIVSAANKYANHAGNVYDRKEVELSVDDGRRFISSSSSIYDLIVLKLVDSWAAQLAGGYALSENYLYTVEAFQQYLRHLDPDHGMLVMVRWNVELPRLLPLVVESLRQEEKSMHDISQQIVVVEDRPGLFFGGNADRTVYPVLVLVKNRPFSNSEIGMVKERAAANDARIIAMPGGYTEPPYDRLLPSSTIQEGPQQTSIIQTSLLKPPTDDSPFYFARGGEIPKQMITLLETVLAVSAALTLLLIYYSWLNQRKRKTNDLKNNRMSPAFHILFVICIGLGFMFLEITFIQKFLLLLGTPIMALTVILFSILLSSGIGAYLSGKLFKRKPFQAVAISIPLLTGILLLYYGFLQEIINSTLAFPINERIALTVALLFPAGLLMGFQFPSITRMTYSRNSEMKNDPGAIRNHEDVDNNYDITLLWGANVIASVIGTVLTVISSMVIGLNVSLLIGAGLYLSALGCAIATTRKIQKYRAQTISK